MTIKGLLDLGIKTRYEVSISAYNFAKSFLEQCRKYREQCDKAEQMTDKMGYQLNELQNSMACFIFCQICLEAYINMYGGDAFSKLIKEKIGDDEFDLLWEKIERLRFEDKWLAVPKILLKKTFKDSEEPYTSLKWLAHKRNFIVHHKSKFRKPITDRLGNRGADIVFTEYTLEEAEKSFQTVKNMIKGLHDLDCSSVPDWLI